MAKKKQNISLTGPVSWNTIHVYLSGELSDKEMYNLERKIQNEPFEQEAFDGFYNHAPASMEKDLEELRDKLQRKTGNRLKEKKPVAIIINWKMLAIIAALVVVIILLLVLLRSKGGDETQQTGMPSKDEVLMLQTEKVAEREATSEATDTVLTKSDTNTASEEIKTKPSQSKESVVREKPKKQEEELGELEAKTDRSDLFQNEENADHSAAEDILVMDAQVDVVAPVNVSGPNTSEDISVQAVKATSDKPVVKREVLSRTPALAPGGLDGYKAYLKSQLFVSSGNLKGSYKLRLKISETGSVEDVDILEGISRRVDKRLVKIIENAPAWSAANENGENISDTATFSLSLE